MAMMSADEWKGRTPLSEFFCSVCFGVFGGYFFFDWLMRKDSAE
jgi:hypothetical protein